MTEQLELILSCLSIQGFDAPMDEAYAAIRAHLERAGTPDDQQARIAGVENVENRLPARGYRGAQL